MQSINRLLSHDFFNFPTLAGNRHYLAIISAGVHRLAHTGQGGIAFLWNFVYVHLYRLVFVNFAPQISNMAGL